MLLSALLAVSCTITLLLWCAVTPLLQWDQNPIVVRPIGTSMWTSQSLQKPHPQRHRYFLHITDIHADNMYVDKGTVLSACHRTKAEDPTEKENLGGRLGAPGERCDSPMELVQQTFDWIAQEWRDKIDFVIWTGDNARHDWDAKRERTKRQIISLNHKVNAMMRDTFGEIPVVPSLGNNDVYPHNEIVENDDILMFYESIWRQWIPVDQRAKFRRNGYFSVHLDDLKVISLNTMLFFKKNNAVSNCHTKGPARGQMTWFEQQLKSAKHQGVSVLVMGHVPPSPRDYRRTCFSEYVRVTTTYSDIITGQFFGHLNMDHFLVYSAKQSLSLSELPPQDSEFHVERNIEKYVGWLRDMYKSFEPSDDEQTFPNPPENAQLSVIQVSPSVIPIYGPTLRIYRYTLDHRQSPRRPHRGLVNLLGYIQYHANISHWQQDQGSLKYEFEYDSEQEYGLVDLSPASISSFIKDMLDGDQDTWTTYARNMFVRTHNDTFPRDGDP